MQTIPLVSESEKKNWAKIISFLFTYVVFMMIITRGDDHPLALNSVSGLTGGIGILIYSFMIFFAAKKESASEEEIRSKN